ncbi:hypothetical protein FRB95_000872 [Tulasnella sp. JGI-2019a]|nr:hypothetical protein FRB95_000872 [Tulasnella sp. JGI-2019a]
MATVRPPILDEYFLRVLHHGVLDSRWQLAPLSIPGQEAKPSDTTASTIIIRTNPTPLSHMVKGPHNRGDESNLDNCILCTFRSTASLLMTLFPLMDLTWGTSRFEEIVDWQPPGKV